jgi:hypothetical protein
MQSFPLSKLADVCERAARFHRLQVSDRSTPFLLEQEVYGLPNTAPRSMRPDGWVKVGVVIDGLENLYLDVWWNPETDRIKLQKPSKPIIKEPTPPALLGDPLYPTPQVSSKALRRPFTARPGYIYLFQGQAYSAEEAEVLTAKLGSTDGWTWRRDNDHL